MNVIISMSWSGTQAENRFPLFLIPLRQAARQVSRKADWPPKTHSRALRPDMIGALRDQPIGERRDLVLSGSSASGGHRPRDSATARKIALPPRARASGAGLRRAAASLPASCAPPPRPRCAKEDPRAALARAARSSRRASEATRLACERKITPSSRIFSALAASVAPVVVMSTMSSACPAAGAPSVAPELSTMR